MTAAAPFYSSKGKQKHHIGNTKLDGRKRQTWPNASGRVILPHTHTPPGRHTTSPCITFVPELLPEQECGPRRPPNSRCTRPRSRFPIKDHELHWFPSLFLIVLKAIKMNSNLFMIFKAMLEGKKWKNNFLEAFLYILKNVSCKQANRDKWQTR